MSPIQENHSPSPDLVNVPNPLPAVPIPLPEIPNTPIPILMPAVPQTPPAKMEQIELATPTFNHSPSPEPDSSPDLPIALRCAKRNIRPPGTWWKVREPTPAIPSDSDDSEDSDDENDAHFAGAAHDLDPQSYKQALRHSDAQLWQEAAKLEMDNNISNGTLELVDLPPGAKCISSGWAFQVKHNADGSIERYKARLVAKNYSQCPGFDYTEVFAPTFRYAAIRTIIALAAINNLHLCSICYLASV